MAQAEYSPEELRKYLLGQMPRVDRAAIDSQRRDDRELVDAIDLAESILIDDYVDLALPAEEKAAFENVFMSTDSRRERLGIARGIRVAAGLVGGLSAIVYRQRSGGVETLRLGLNSRRAGEQTVLRLSEAASTVILEFECPSVPPTHTFTLGRVGEPTPLLQLRIASPESKVIKLPIEKALLAPGDYLAVLSSGDEFRADFRLVVVP
jgi:hypothetical protein